MSNVDIRGQLDPLLNQLAAEKSLDVAEKLAATLVGFLGVTVADRYLLDIPRVDAELSRFQLAPGFARQAAAYELPNDHESSLDLKIFWIKKTSKTNLSWLVGLTPNFEDSEANDYKNIGIDFVVPETCDSLLILLSNKYKIRSLELKGHLTQTQLEIFTNWASLSNKQLSNQVESKKFYHYKLWESFNFEPINRKFYLELVEHFNLLVNHLESIYERKSSVMFTTRLIGRILFVWFLRKKNLINRDISYFTLDDPYKQTDYYKKKLEVLFFGVLNKEFSERDITDTVTPYLNGGLFDVATNDFFNDQNLSFPNGFFNQLFDTLNKYNFTVDESSPEFQQVAIDPEMLGRIFESLLAEQVDDDTGATKKKATGAFYTPREIVNYMCERSLIEYLKTKIPETPDRDRRIEELVTLPETVFRDQDQNKRRDWKPYCEQIIIALQGKDDQSPITILDPAVGSGAFPMGMLHLLVKIYGRLDSKYEKNISDLKRKILANSLYGVDIEQTAIEICRLRAWLSIIVDVNEALVVEPLPNLDFKFTCANTLINLEDSKQDSLFSDPQLKEKLLSIRDRYFNISSKKQKGVLQKEYESLTHHENLFDDLRTKQLKTYKPFDNSASSDFYDPELHHGVAHFDIVIGNPPYVGEKGNKELFRRVAATPLGKRFYQGKTDLFYYFFHIGCDYLKPKGILSFITTNYFITATAASKLRADIKARCSVLQMLNFGNLKIFDSAKGQHNLITILEKGKSNKQVQTCVTRRQGYLGNDVLNSIVSFNDSETDYFEFDQNELFLDGDIRLEKSSIDEPLDYIASSSLTVGEIACVSEGIQTGANSVFLFDGFPSFYDELNDSEKSLFKPFFKNSDIKKYFHSKETRKNILYIPRDLNLEDGYPKIMRYLNEHKKVLSDRAQIKRSKQNWYTLLWARNVNLFESEAIVTSYRPVSPSFAYKDGSFYSGTDTYYINQPREGYPLKFILALLNSKIAQVWFRYRGKVKGDILEMTGDNIEKFPIPNIQYVDPALIKNIIANVDSIMAIAEKNQSDITFLETEIDDIVFRVYGLNEAQISLFKKVLP